MAQFDRLSIDPELFMIANLFHDIGLVDSLIEQASLCCFTMTSGRIAATFVKERGWDDRKAQRVYELISLHLNPYVDPRTFGAEEALVGAAASLDLLGTQYQRIPLAVIRSVHHNYDRSGFSEEMRSRIQGKYHQADTRPRFYANIGARRFVEKSPLERLFK